MPPLHDPFGPCSVSYVDVVGGGGGEEPSLQPPVHLRLYYPCEAQDPSIRSSSAYWLPNTLLYSQGYARFLGLPRWFGYLAAPFMYNIRIPCRQHVPPLTNQPPFPVILFSHGLGGTRTMYSRLCIGLASHGFVVVALEHGDGTASVTTDHQGDQQPLWYLHPPPPPPSGISVYTTEKGNTQNKDDHLKAFRRGQLNHRVQEMQSAWRVLMNMSTPPDQVTSIQTSSPQAQQMVELLHGQLDMDSLFLAGHSFGAMTVITCSQRKVIPAKAIVTYDPWMFAAPDGDTSPLHHPHLSLQSETFHWPENYHKMECVLLGQRQEADEFGVLYRTAHQDVSDCLILLPWIMRASGMGGTANPVQTLTLCEKWTLTFLRRQLLAQGKECAIPASYEEDLFVRMEDHVAVDEEAWISLARRVGRSSDIDIFKAI